MRNKDVVTAFIEQSTAASLNLCSEGRKLYSYNTCIAQWYNTSIIFNTSHYSNTTNHHQDLLRREVGTKFPIVEVNGVPRDTKDLKFFILNYNNKYDV